MGLLSNLKLRIRNRKWRGSPAKSCSVRSNKRLPSVFIAIGGVFAVAHCAAALPTPADISWTDSGGIRVDGWLAIEERYKEGRTVTNQVLKKTADTIEYQNELVKIRKRWRLENNSLIIEQQIDPRTEAGKQSELILKIEALRQFGRFYTPYGFSSPNITGKWIAAGDMARIECGYHGAYSNSMLYSLLHGQGGAVMLDRVLSNGYLAWEGGIRDAEGDFSKLTWPMLGYGHWSWNTGHPGPVKAWMQNVYPPEGGSAEYRLHFFDDASIEELPEKAHRLYLEARKKVAIERKIYQGWEASHRVPDHRVGFYGFVAQPWGGGLTKAGNSFVDRLARLREVLDESGMPDAVIYFWVQLYDGKRAGWGEFPLDHQETRDFLEKVRSKVHTVKLGLYVHPWIASVEAAVYKEHPEWFTGEFHKTDGNEDSYAGKLPEWGDWLIDQMPPLIDAYDLDCIFFDGADWAPRWRGTHEQSRQFFSRLSETLHAHGADFLINGNVPFADFGMTETVAGMDTSKDRGMSANFQYMSFHDATFGPEFTPSPAHRAPVEDSGKAVLKYYIDRPEFIIRWPAHYGGDEHEKILKEYFAPWARRRAELTKE